MDEFNRQWITEQALDEIGNYEPGVLTLGGLHYRLVSRGMTNSLLHYKRVVNALIKARWDGLGQVELDAIEPKKLQSVVEGAILEHLDEDLRDQLEDLEEYEAELFRANLKQFVQTL